jgi:hypothetical protein
MNQWTYAQAIEAARAEIDAGHAISYGHRRHRDKGLIVEIETAAGWHPEPWWQEYPDDTRPGGANDTNPDQ